MSNADRQTPVSVRQHLISYLLATQWHHSMIPWHKQFTTAHTVISADLSAATCTNPNPNLSAVYRRFYHDHWQNINVSSLSSIRVTSRSDTEVHAQCTETTATHVTSNTAHTHTHTYTNRRGFAVMDGMLYKLVTQEWYLGPSRIAAWVHNLGN